MSKWHCDYDGFQRFVRLTVAPLKLAANHAFRFLELGVCLAAVAFCPNAARFVDHFPRWVSVLFPGFFFRIFPHPP